MLDDREIKSALSRRDICSRKLQSYGSPGGAIAKADSARALSAFLGFPVNAHRPPRPGPIDPRSPDASILRQEPEFGRILLCIGFWRGASFALDPALHGVKFGIGVPRSL